MQNNDSMQPGGTSGKVVRGKFEIAGMTCGGCVRHVTRTLQSLPVQIEFITQGQTILSYGPDAITRHEIVRAIANAGYKITEAEQS